MRFLSCSVAGREVDAVVAELRSLHQKYRHIEQEIVRRAQRLMVKEPELLKCVSAVEALVARKDAGEPAVLDFSLSNHVFARARIDEPSTVHLWLGAGVMLEYPLEEALRLLNDQLEGCRKQLAIVEFEKEYIRDQVTTTEVSVARIYNFGVAARRKEAEDKKKTDDN